MTSTWVAVGDADWTAAGPGNGSAPPPPPTSLEERFAEIDQLSDEKAARRSAKLHRPGARPPLRDSDYERIRLHESAHAAVSYKGGWPCSELLADQRGRFGHMRHHGMGSDPIPPDPTWPTVGSLAWDAEFRDDAKIQACISLAGPIADVRLTGECDGGDDLRDVNRILRGLVGDSHVAEARSRLWQQTEQLVHAMWPQICALAELLRTRDGVLQGDELRSALAQLLPGQWDTWAPTLETHHQEIAMSRKIGTPLSKPAGATTQVGKQDSTGLAAVMHSNAQPAPATKPTPTNVGQPSAHQAAGKQQPTPPRGVTPTEDQVSRPASPRDPTK